MSQINRLLSIMAKLRDPNDGCPWDLAQSFETIAPYTLEEAYEVVDAIERKNYVDVQDELGDLLLQVVFHSQIASERELFAFEDVAQSICDKLERRHPHVFAQENASDATQVKANWQQIKRQERGSHASLLSGIPLALPALKKSQKLGSRASSIGFDWPDATGARAKIIEEIVEVDEAIASGDKQAVHNELGDLLFAVVNMCRHQGVDAEAALATTNSEFARRFRYVERRVKEAEAEGAQVNLQFMDTAWEQAKKDNKNN